MGRREDMWLRPHLKRRLGMDFGQAGQVARRHNTSLLCFQAGLATAHRKKRRKGIPALKGWNF